MQNKQARKRSKREITSETFDELCCVAADFLTAQSNRQRKIALSRLMNLRAAMLTEQAIREYDEETERIHGRKMKRQAQVVPLESSKSTGIIVLRDEYFDAKAIFIGDIGRQIFGRLDMPMRETFRIDDRVRHIDIGALYPMKVQEKKAAKVIQMIGGKVAA